MNTNHLSKEVLARLLSSGCEDDLDSEMSAHLADCSECQAALDEIAAAPKMWEKVSELISEPLISDLAVKRAAISFGSQADELTSDHELREITSDTAELLLDPPSHPEMLGRIGSYDIEREVGRGGMGIVFKGFDSELHRPVAVKVLAPWLAQNGTARKRFAREARAAAAVIHPNVISIYGVNSNKKTPYLVMPFVAGPSLQRLIDEHGPLDEKDIVRIAMQVSAGLGAAHTQGLVHRDIKPANILVEPEVSRVLVTDFGLARAVDDASATQSGYFVGTPNYMSPEQGTGKRIDGRSDLFSLGSVMYFMATGCMPFRAESPLGVLNRISHDEPTGIRRVNNEISKTLSDIVVKLLEKSPDDRFQTAGEVHETLEKYLAYLHQPDVSKPPTIKLRRRKQGTPSRSHRWGYLLAGAGAIAVLLGLSVVEGWLPNRDRRDATQNKADASAWNDLRSAAQQTSTTLPANDSSSNSAANSGDDPALEVPGRFVAVEESELGENVDGYSLYLPESYSKTAKPYPIIFYLQGVSSVGGEIDRMNQWGLTKLVADHQERDGELSKLLRDGFIIVSPHITHGGYDQDVAAMRRILRDVLLKYQADESRVYMTGISLGGTGTWALASQLGEILAAAAPMAGQPFGVDQPGVLANTPMWVAHNVGDEFMPVAKMVAKLNRLTDTQFKAIDAACDLSSDDLKSPKIFVTGETTNHDSWTRVYTDPQFYRWLLQHRR